MTSIWLASDGFRQTNALIAVLAEKMRQPVWSYDHQFDLMRAVRWD